MAISAMTLAVALTLKDQFSSPLRGATAAVDRLGGALQRAAGPGAALSTRLHAVTTSVKALGDRVGLVGRQLSLFGGMVEMAAGVGLKSYITNVVETEHRLRALGNTAGLSAGQLAAIDQRLNAMARATNQFKSELLGANEALMAAGLDWRTALDITPILGKTATASQAAMGDLARIAVRAQQNMGVPVAQMQDLFDRLTVAGESGMFELKAMAQYLPALTASMGALKFTGIENIDRLGAALQIAFMGAGEAGVAANNLQNFLDKLAAPVTLKNFKDAGINLEKVLVDARAKGLDPLLVTMKQIQKATGGNEFKIGELFGDQQVLAYIKPMLANLERYRQILGGMGAAAGKSAKNFDNMMMTTQERWKAFVIKMQTTPMPWLDKLIERVSKALDWANQNPEWAETIVLGLTAITTAGLGLAVVGPVVASLAAGLGGLVGLMSRAAPLAAGMAAGSAGGAAAGAAGAGAAGAAGAGAAGAGAGAGAASLFRQLGMRPTPVGALARWAPTLLGLGRFGLHGAAVGGGAAIGVALNKEMQDLPIGRWLDEKIASGMAALGSEDAQLHLGTLAKRRQATMARWMQEHLPSPSRPGASLPRLADLRPTSPAWPVTLAPGAVSMPAPAPRVQEVTVPRFIFRHQGLDQTKLAADFSPRVPFAAPSLSSQAPPQNLTEALSVKLGPAVDTIKSAGEEQREAGTLQRTAAQEFQTGATSINGAAALFSGSIASLAAAAASLQSIGGTIQIQVTGPGKVTSVAKTPGSPVDLAAGYTGAAMPEAAR